MRLAERDCKTAAPRKTPFKLFDGGGMYLLTQPNGRKYWRMKYRFDGKEKLLALGVFPAVSLREARDQRDAARELLGSGVDPSVSKAMLIATPRAAVKPAAANRLTPIGRANSIAHDVIVQGSKGKTNSNKPTTAALAEVPTLDSHLCFALYAASNRMTRLFVPFLQTLGVTYPQYLVLVVLWGGGAHGIGELAANLNMDFGTLSPMLKRLEAKGLISRRRDPADERRVVVSLTSRGEALRKRTRQMLGEFYCFLNLPLEELFDLRDRLRRFVQTAGPAELRLVPATRLESG